MNIGNTNTSENELPETQLEYIENTIILINALNDFVSN